LFVFVFIDGIKTAYKKQKQNKNSIKQAEKQRQKTETKRQGMSK
jgi:hypothetical protein